MATEPQRPSEELLQAWAAQRRAEAGTPELHPATRRMLQAEVARTHGPAAAPTGEKRNWLAGWWPRLALVGSTLAAVIVLTLVLWPHRASETQFARATLPDARPMENKDSLLPMGIPLTVRDTDQAEHGLSKTLGGAFSLSNASPLAAARRGVTLAPADIPDRTALSSRAVGEDIVLDTERLNASKPALASVSTDKLQPPSVVSPAPVSPMEQDNKNISLKGTTLGMELAANEKRKLATELVGPGETLQRKEAELTENGKKIEMTKADFAAAAKSPESSLSLLAPAAATAPLSPPISEPAKVSFRAAGALADSAGAKALGGRADEAQVGTAQSAAVNTLRFSQADNRARFRSNFNSPAVPDVLNTFQFEQSGLDVRITDGDGSVYVGKIDSVQSQTKMYGAPAGTVGAVREEQARVTGAVQQGVLSQQANVNQNISFRVEGTNHTSQRRVEFEGNLLLPVDQRAQQQVRGAMSNQAPAQNFVPGAQIEGIATTGSVKINVRANATP